MRLRSPLQFGFGGAWSLLLLALVVPGAQAPNPLRRIGHWEDFASAPEARSLASLGLGSDRIPSMLSESSVHTFDGPPPLPPGVVRAAVEEDGRVRGAEDEQTSVFRPLRHHSLDLKLPFGLNAGDEEWQTLMTAAEEAQDQERRMGQPSFDDDGFQHALEEACRSGEHNHVVSLLAQGASLSVADHAGRFPLHLAVYHGHAELVAVLMLMGADPNVGALRDGVTPIMLSMQLRRLTITVLLLRHSDVAVEFGIRDLSHGRNLIHYAAQYGTSFKLLRWMLTESEPKDVAKGIWTARDAQGRSPFMLAAYYGNHAFLFCFAAIPESMMTVSHFQSLLSEDPVSIKLDRREIRKAMPAVDVNEHDVDGNTALHLAAERNRRDILRLLLAGGANPNLRNREGQSALDLCTLACNVECVRVLVEGGAQTDRGAAKLFWSLPPVCTSTSTPVAPAMVELPPPPEEPPNVQETSVAPRISFRRASSAGEFPQRKVSTRQRRRSGSAGSKLDQFQQHRYHPYSFGPGGPFARPAFQIQRQLGRHVLARDRSGRAGRQQEQQEELYGSLSWITADIPGT